jgi:hypothetical protein
MKNCIVLSGQYRTFDQTAENIVQFIKLNNLDVYCHLWTDNIDEKRLVTEKLKPEKYLFEKPNSHTQIFEEMETRIRTNNPKPGLNDKVAGNASMNYSRKQAFNLIEKEYETVVYCRYDIGFTDLFEFKEIDRVFTPVEESYNLISDIFAIMPMKYAKHYFLYDEYEKLHSTQFEEKFETWLREEKKYGEENIRIHKYDRYCPHMMLLRNLLTNNVPVAVTNLPVYLKR